MLEKEIIHSYNSNPRDPLKSEPIDQNPDELLETNQDSGDSNLSNIVPNNEDEKYRSKEIHDIKMRILISQAAEAESKQEEAQLRKEEAQYRRDLAKLQYETAKENPEKLLESLSPNFNSR